MPDPPAAIVLTGPLEFQAMYLDEEVLCHVRYMTDDEGEEHIVSLLPRWETQISKINQAFGREMVPDPSRQSKGNVVYVKAADGSLPDPTFERSLKYTLGDDTTEYFTRVHKGQTTRDVKKALKRLHAGANPSKIVFEGAEMADEDAVTEWSIETGTSPLKVKVVLDQPMQHFQLWQTSGIFDLGSEELDGRPREEIWRSLKQKNPFFLRKFEDYGLFVGQNEIQWEDLPALDATFVPRAIPVINRGLEFKISDKPRVDKLRNVGPLTQMTFQVFTIEKNPIGEPIEILAPNEITLGQLVTNFILPEMQLESGSIFYWNLKEIDLPVDGDKTKRILEQIPSQIPIGFSLRVKCNTLRDNSAKRMAHAHFLGAQGHFAMLPGEKVGRLKERVADWMNQSGQGSDWTIERPDDEEIDFEWNYEVVPIAREVPLRIFLKQMELEILPSTSWINLSDQLVKKWKLPKGTLLRIFPVSGTVENKDDEDHSYTITWEADKQYWFDVVYDPSKDRDTRSKAVVMIDPSDRTDTFVVPIGANVHQVRDLWKRFLEIPHVMEMHMQTANDREYYWSLETSREVVAFSFKATNFHGNAFIFEGSPTFVAEQLSRNLSLKLPPLVLCQQTPRRGHGPAIQFDGDVPTLDQRLLKEHRLAWNLAGTTIHAPAVSTWWLPYNRQAIMNYGHSVNTSIPADPNEAEFPDEPWPQDVCIRIKSQAPPQVPAIPLPAGDLQGSPASDFPTGWKGPALGEAPPISEAASSLVGYTSENRTRPVEGQQEDPPDENLERFRG
jgi:hypothetical protein